jgi:NADH-ubiquinone oxidoreductase chain 6
LSNLIIINEYITNGYNDEILNIFYLFIIINGIFVIILKNPVISILFLIGLFSGVASYLILLGLSFIGISYLIVYVGAVSILFLFILMLINVRISELQSNTINSLPLVIITLLLFSNLLFQLLFYNVEIVNKNNNFLVNLGVNRNNIFFVLSKIWDGNLVNMDYITSIGNILYTNYNMWLIITSFILLLAMVGTIVITIKQND